MPERIQRRRTKGWRMPEGAIYVGRPGPWGNQFKVIERSWLGWEVCKCIDGRLGGAPVGFYLTKAGAIAAAVSHYRKLIMGPEGALLRRRAQAELRGHDLACFCRLDQPCHADILLALANSAPEE